MQNNGNSSNTTDEHFISNCNLFGQVYGHMTPIRELPYYTMSVYSVAVSGWWVTTNSISNIRERDNLSSVVSTYRAHWVKPVELNIVHACVHVFIIIIQFTKLILSKNPLQCLGSFILHKVHGNRIIQNNSLSVAFACTHPTDTISPSSRSSLLRASLEKAIVS